MARYFIAIAFALALLVPGVLSGTSATSLSLTAASFAQSPSTVFDNTNSAAGTAGADATAWGTAYTEAYFGPAADNTTTISYAIDADSSTISKVIARISNSSLLANGTADTTLYAKKSDATASFTAVTYVSKKVAVGLGSIAIAYTAASGSATYAANQNLYLLIVSSSGSVTLNKAIVSPSVVACVGTSGSEVSGKAYTFTINDVWYENSTYFVSYTTVTATYTSASGTCPTDGSPTSNLETKASLQGYSADSTATLKWTAAVDYYTPSAGLATGTIASRCGPSNYTNSTVIYCTAFADASATATLNAYGILTSAGTISNTTAIAANSAPATGTIKYTVAGFVYGMYQNGILLNCQTYTTASTSYANTLNFYNMTSGASSTTGATSGGIVISGYSTTTAAGMFTGAGIQDGTGYALLIQYQSAAASTTANSQTPAAYTIQYAAYLANGTISGSIITIGTVAAGNTAAGICGNFFVDTYTSLWFGGYSYGYTTSGTTGAGAASEIYVGKVGQVIATTGSSSAGNILASFFALITLMIAALFAF